MARNSRHNKIIELITVNEIETQEELVKALRGLKFDVTQATVSRDIKELGLIKILTEDKRYKYALSNASQTVSDKIIDTVKPLIIDKIVVNNQVIIKVVEGTAQFVSSSIKKCSILEILAIVHGDDAVLIITANDNNANVVADYIDNIFSR